MNQKCHLILFLFIQQQNFIILIKINSSFNTKLKLFKLFKHLLRIVSSCNIIKNQDKFFNVFFIFMHKSLCVLRTATHKFYYCANLKND